MSQVADAILHTLDQTGLSPAGPVLILLPPDARLSARFPGATVWHPLAGQVSQWSDRQHPVLLDLSDAQGFQSVIIFCPRQKDETLYLIARGLELLQAGGTLIAACDNQSGGQSLPKLFQSLIGEANNLSKHKCRVIWTTAPESALPSAVASALTK